MSEEQIISYKIQYDVRGIDSTIRQSQRLLYFTNAVRLAYVDLQQFMSAPTVANFMWTAIQLTRVWTTAYRWIKMTNEAQRLGIAQGALRGIGGRAAGRGFSVGQQMLPWAAKPLLATLPTVKLGVGIAGMGLALGIPVAVLIGLFILGDIQERRTMKDWEQRQREVAKSQGLEW